MRETIEALMRWMLLLYLLVGAAWSFDLLLVVAKALSGYTGDVHIGAPWRYCENRHDESPYDEPERHRSGTECDGAALAADLIVLAAIGGCFAVGLNRALRSDRSQGPVAQQPGPTPLLPEATRGYPQLRALARRSRWCLVFTVLGSLFGLGAFFGPLGWSCGSRLRRRYHMLGRRPPWTATTTWVVGAATAVTVLVCAVGVLASAVL